MGYLHIPCNTTLVEFRCCNQCQQREKDGLLRHYFVASSNLSFGTTCVQVKLIWQPADHRNTISNHPSD